MMDEVKDQYKAYEVWKSKFPLCFSREGCCMTFGIECNSGWNGVIEELLSKIESHLAEHPSLMQGEEYTRFQIDQIKEKFGGLRFYVSGGDEHIHKLIDETEDLSTKTCEKCGAGDSKIMVRKGHFWLYNRCEECAKNNPELDEYIR